MKNISNFDWNRPSILLISFGMEALGVRNLSAFLKKMKCKVNILFLEHALAKDLSYCYRDLIAYFINYNRYDIVGFSCMTGDFYEACSITESIKLLKNRPIIIWGGVHATTCHDECLIQGKADIVFKGPAEKSLNELLSGSPLNKVSNIAYINNKEIISKYDKIQLYDPDSMPFPDYDFEDHFIIEDRNIVRLDVNIFRERYQWGGTHYFAITARGCPYNCAYCCNIYRGNYQRKSVNYFMEELGFIKKKLPFFKTLSIQDDSLFINDMKWITDFSNKYKNLINKPIRASLMPRFASHEKLEPLSEAGLIYIGIGLQRSSRLNKEIYGRNETSESFLRAVNNYKRYGIVGRVDVIIDNPYEREDDLIEISHVLNEVPKPFPISVYTLTLFPGTKMSRKAHLDGTEHLFVGDPYEPNLCFSMNKREAYRTPDHWRWLFISHLPNLPKIICKYLINNINNQNVQDKIIRYWPWSNKVREIGSKLRMVSPRSFDNALKQFHKIVH